MMINEEYLNESVRCTTTCVHKVQFLKILQMLVHVPNNSSKYELTFNIKNNNIYEFVCLKHYCKSKNRCSIGKTFSA